MITRTTSACLLALACIAPHCSAQLIGPIPPPTPPTPEYVPPEKRDVPVVTPPTVEPPAPSIVERDDQGRLRPLKGTPEEAAVAAYAFDAPRRARIEASAAARKLELDRFVIAKLDKVLAARKVREKVESTSNLDDLFQARELNVALRYERLIDRLERDRAITAAQRVRLDETLLNYDKARKEEVEKDTGKDPTRMGILAMRQTFRDTMREPFESYERQMDDVGRNFWKLVDDLTLTADQRAALERFRGESKPGNIEETSHPESVKRVRAFMDAAMDTEQRRTLMTKRLAERVERK